VLTRVVMSPWLMCQRSEASLVHLEMLQTLKLSSVTIDTEQRVAVVGDVMMLSICIFLC